MPENPHRRMESPLIGRRLGVYEITARLGEGGMGEVYRARDTRLGRDVAIKVLPQDFMSDPERLMRFEREARVLASLNHPHIAAIYGIEATDDIRSLVLELVDGETLADRVKRGQIPVKEALTIARQIADALDAAHEKGIVHRDLKPANVAITREGVVKVLDFGVAKFSPESEALRSEAPTSDRTQEGTSMGTLRYMSPEQARGKEVDKRTDVWAFGCVLYEMLTGRQAFGGETSSDTIVAILERDPDWTFPASTPESIQRLLRRCLEKDPRQRLRDVADARLEVEEALNPAHRPKHTRPRSLRSLSVAAAGLLLAGALGAYFAWKWTNSRSGTSAPATTIRLIVLPFENLSRQADDEWLAGAFSDSLTLGLRDAENIVLVNRERLMELGQGGHPDAGQIARTLGVQYYVNGSYQRVGETLRVVARLVDAGAGTIKQQEIVTDQFANLLSLEDNLGRRFAATLEATTAGPKRVTTSSLEAYRAVAEANDLYLAGRFREAIQLLEKATSQDERYAEAWALLGKSYAQLIAPNNIDSDARSELLDRALEASQRAIALEPSLYEAQVALATTYQQLERVESWRIAAQKAIDLNPRLAEGYVLMGDSYGPSPGFGCARKRDSELSERSYRKALELNPKFGAAHARLITNFFWSGRENDALNAANEALRLLPDNISIMRARAAALLWLGRADALEQQVRQFEAIVGPTGLDQWAKGAINVLRGNTEDGEQQFKSAMSSGSAIVRGIDTGRFYANVGRTEDAARYLQQAFALDSSCATFVSESPAFAKYRDSAPIRALLSQYLPSQQNPGTK